MVPPLLPAFGGAGAIGGCLYYWPDWCLVDFVSFPTGLQIIFQWLLVLNGFQHLVAPVYPLVINSLIHYLVISSARFYWLRCGAGLSNERWLKVSRNKLCNASGVVCVTRVCTRVDTFVSVGGACVDEG